VNYGDPKFSIGDLVFFNEEQMGEVISGLGIIVAIPTLMFTYERKEGEPRENYWSYDIKVENTLFKMIPETFIRSIKDEDKTKNT